MRNILILSLVYVLSGCAVMHHTQVGEVDSRTVLSGRRFQVIVSETGFSMKEAMNTGSAVARASGDMQTAQNIQGAKGILALFQMGPKTGLPTFTDRYADDVYYAILEECPSGKVSGVTSVREMAKYPVISGEIVRIIGYCSR